MINRYHFKTRCLSICASLITLLILHPLNIFAEQGQGNIDKIVKVKDGLVSVNAEDEATFNILKETEVSDVLKKIEKETGVKMTIGNGLAGKKIETDFVDMDIESSLRRLLNGTYYVLHYDQDQENKDKQIWKEVRAGGAELGSIPIKRKVTSIEIPYGSGKGEVGAVIGSEGSSGGPQSFDVDDAGNIYICDSINNRVQIFSMQGEYISTVPLKSGTSAGDIAVDKFGSVYVYDGREGKLLQYDKKGLNVATIAIDDSQWSGRGSMQIIDNDIYMYTGHEKDVNIGRISDGKLMRAFVKDIGKIEKGRVGVGGKRYAVKKMERGVSVEWLVKNQDGALSRLFSFPLKDTLARAILGEDKRGDFYILTVLSKDNDLFPEVDKFNSDGDYLGTIQFPRGIPEFTSAKDFINKDGNIYNFVPEKDKLKINIFISEEK